MNKASLRIVIVGGGYAGLSALIALREKSKDAEITLIDPNKDHVKLTHLHETFRKDQDQVQVRLPYRLIAERFGIQHVEDRVLASEDDLRQWNRTGTLLTKGGISLGFDYLLLASGTSAQNTCIDQSHQILTLDDFVRTPGPELLKDHLPASNRRTSWITVVGGGATGVQFLFEIAFYIREQKLPWKLRLVDSGHQPLQQMGSAPARYVRARLDELGIDYIPNHYFLQQREGKVALEARETFERRMLPSELTLYFSGKKARNLLNTNWFGQVKVAGRTLRSVFSSGDCAVYSGPGSNSMSAQSAVRKGHLAAQNILRHRRPLGLMRPYLHRDLGYVVSMGPWDAVGWLGTRNNVIAGKPAVAVKDVVESQYELLLAGTNSFLL